MKKLIFISLVLIFLCTFMNVMAEETARDYSNIAVGDMITFGRYEQDNNLDNGPEDIEWIVLDVQDGKALLLSKYGLDAKPYYTGWVVITWEQCTLRTWLNQDFLKAAFSDAEQSAILTTHVDNSDAQGYSGWDTPGGNDTEDQIFLLSYHEAFDLYFTSDEARKCVPTDYAVANGAWTSSTNMLSDRPTGSWWLRLTGAGLAAATSVYSDGSRGQHVVDYAPCVIRPALWVKLETDTTTTELAAEVPIEKPAEPTIEPTKKPMSDKLDSTPFKTVGNIVSFGSYEQDNDLSDGPEPIEWLVLDVQDGKALLFSRYILDKKPYNTERVDTSWEECTMRKWLNTEFLDAAFSEKEQLAILTTEVNNGRSQGGAPGKKTQDRVFLLSVREARTYFEDIESRKCALTDYVIANIEYKKNSLGPAAWWLRSLDAHDSRYALLVDTYGSERGIRVDSREGVRPTLWVNLESDIF